MKKEKDSRQFVVIGLGQFGLNMARALHRMGYEVLAVDTRIERVQEYSNEFTHVVQADATDENALRELGILNFDVVVVAIGDNMEANLLTTMQLKDLGAPYIVAMARDPLQVRLLKKIGVDRIVSPDADMANRVAYNLATTNIMDYIELSEDISIVELAVPLELQDKTLAESDVRVRYGLNVVAIKRGEQLLVSPAASEKLQASDTIVVVGSNDGISRLEENL